MNLERAALLKCRFAARMDALGDVEHYAKSSPEEAAEEQAASFVRVPDHVFRDLEAAGKLYRSTPGTLRLTDEGHAMLGDPIGARVYILGNEGALKVTALEPTRTWITFHRLGETRGQTEERVMLGAHNFNVKGRVLKDGGFLDRMSGKRTLFYCRILPDEEREPLAAIDASIVEAEKQLAQLRVERQELLSAAARRGAKVPMPPRTEPKPEGK